MPAEVATLTIRFGRVRATLAAARNFTTHAAAYFTTAGRFAAGGASDVTTACRFATSGASDVAAAYRFAAGIAAKAVSRIDGRLASTADFTTGAAVDRRSGDACDGIEKSPAGAWAARSCVASGFVTATAIAAAAVAPHRSGSVEDAPTLAARLAVVVPADVAGIACVGGMIDPRINV